MEPAQAKPVRRRRRRLIVAFVLVLVSLVSWWYWPGGATRFVGKWSTLENTMPPSRWVYEFRANGDATCSTHNGDFFRFCWWVNGDDLFMVRIPNNASVATRFWAALMGRLPGRSLRYGIVETADHYLILRTQFPGDPSSRIFELSRLPE